MSTPKPSTHGSNGRTAGGRFAPGNREGRGNPLAGRAARIRAKLLKTKPADIDLIIAKLVEKAKGGDLASIHEFLNRTIGKPVQSELLERIEELERRMMSGHANGGARCN